MTCAATPATTLDRRWHRLLAGEAVADVALHWRRGTLADYRALSEFHYLSHQPVTATRVIVVEQRGPTVISRFHGSPDSASIVGVLVESYPALSCASRDKALHGRYRDWSNRTMAARLLNREMRCISRVVVHPQYRGLGLAVAMVRHALQTAETRYTEALAAMGAVHPFFRLAGMREYRRWPLQRDQRLIDAMQCCGIAPWRLAASKAMQRWLQRQTDRARLMRRELDRWAGRDKTLGEQIAAVRQHLLTEPLYYLYEHKDTTCHA